MKLYEQLFSLIYHIIIGQLLGFIYSLFSILCINSSSIFKTLVNTILSILCTCLYYYGLYMINGGMLHIYLFLALFISFYIYYSFFYVILIPFFVTFKGFLKPFKRKLDFEKKKIYGIMIKYKRKGKKNESKYKEKKIKQNSISS